MASPGASSSSSLTPIPSSAAPGSPLSLPSTSNQSSFALYRTTVTATLRDIATTLTQQRANGQGELGQDEMRVLVEEGMAKVEGARAKGKPLAEGEVEEPRWRTDARTAATGRAAEEIVNEAATLEAESPIPLQAALDLVLALQETGFVDEMLPLNILSSLMELRPISACEGLFGYIESRVERLTKNMEFQRGRGPILLRLLNDLLRRLPRSQSASVILSGRILLLLSSVYPLGEKSGVNLRGNFNVGKTTSWEKEEEKEKEPKVEVIEVDEDEKIDGEKSEGEKETKKMEVEEGEEPEAEQKPTGNPAVDDPSTFYPLFWSLQPIFSNPPLLFTSPPTPAASSSSSTSSPPPTFATLHHALSQTLKAFSAATKREKELSGTSHGKEAEKARLASGGGSAEAEEEVHMKDGDEQAQHDAEHLEEFFFPKFLTSRNLLDLELSSPPFRLQLLLQTLILLQYLLSLTSSARARAALLPVTNPAYAQTSFVLPPEEEKWAKEMREEVLDEMDSMWIEGEKEGGRRFRKAVGVVLQREQNWTDWKLRSCLPFTRTPAAPVAEQSEKARGRIKSLTQRPKKFPYQLGTPSLHNAWQKNTKSLEEMEANGALEEGADNLDLLFRNHRLEKNRLKQEEAQFARAPPGSAKRAELENAIESRRYRLQSLQWRAIRLASTSHLSFFSRIGSGDLETLQQLIDEQRRAKEEAEEAAAEGREVEVEAVKAEEGEGEEEDGEGYGSDESALGLGRAEEQRKRKVEREKKEKEAKEAKEKAEKEEEERKTKEAAAKVEKEREESGTPPPPSASASTTKEVEMKSLDDSEEGGTPPPPPSKSLSLTVPPSATTAANTSDEPGTPPRSAAAARLASPGTPGTPKRSRPVEDEGKDGDVDMGDAGTEVKRARRS